MRGNRTADTAITVTVADVHLADNESSSTSSSSRSQRRSAVEANKSVQRLLNDEPVENTPDDNLKYPYNLMTHTKRTFQQIQDDNKRKDADHLQRLAALRGETDSIAQTASESTDQVFP